MLSERSRLVTSACLASDAAATSSALVAAYALRAAVDGMWDGLMPLYPLSGYLLLLGVVLPVWALVFYASGLYGEKAARTTRTELSRLVWAVSVAALVLFCIIFAAKLDYVSRLVVAVFLLLDLVFVAAGRAMVRGAVFDGTRRRIVIAGGHDQVARAVAQVDAHRDWGLEIVGLATDGTWTRSEELPYRVLGAYEDVPSLVLAGHEIHEVLIAPSLGRIDDVKRLEPVFLQLEELGVVTRLVLNFLPRALSELSFGDFSGMPLLTFSTAPRDELLLFIRRCADVVLAVALMAVTSPFLLLIALAVKLSSPGPVLFRQTRCGLHGRPFTFLKFRSMYADAEQLKPHLAAYNEMDGPAFKMTNDPRATPLGRWLRRTSLDELPQLWNILKGDMSFVGPRPAVVEEVRQYEPWQRRRLSMPPGLTCLWQVSGRNDLSFEEWMKLDLEYIDNWSLWLDVKIALRTIPAVLMGRGAK